MRIYCDSGLLEAARQLETPNCDERPTGSEIDLVVIHGISLPPGSFGGPWVDHLFCNTLDPDEHEYFQTLKDVHVSAHLFISRSGEIMQYVPFGMRAWHAGESAFEGRERCNDYSIGIELEGTDHTPYEDIQYSRLADILHALMKCYPGITPQRITGHCDVAGERKTDPGPAFDWVRLRGLLHLPPEE